MERYDFSAMAPETVRAEMDNPVEEADRLVAAAWRPESRTWADTVVRLTFFGPQATRPSPFKR